MICMLVSIHATLLIPFIIIFFILFLLWRMIIALRYLVVGLDITRYDILDFMSIALWHTIVDLDTILYDNLDLISLMLTS